MIQEDSDPGSIVTLKQVLHRMPGLRSQSVTPGRLPPMINLEKTLGQSTPLIQSKPAGVRLSPATLKPRGNSINNNSRHSLTPPTDSPISTRTTKISRASSGRRTPSSCSTSSYLLPRNHCPSRGPSRDPPRGTPASTTTASAIGKFPFCRSSSTPGLSTSRTPRPKLMFSRRNSKKKCAVPCTVQYRTFGTSSDGHSKTSMTGRPLISNPYQEMNKETHTPFQCPRNAPTWMCVATQRLVDRHRPGNSGYENPLGYFRAEPTSDSSHPSDQTNLLFREPSDTAELCRGERSRQEASCGDRCDTPRDREPGDAAATHFGDELQGRGSRVDSKYKSCFDVYGGQAQSTPHDQVNSAHAQSAPHDQVNSAHARWSPPAPDDMEEDEDDDEEGLPQAVRGLDLGRSHLPKLSAREVYRERLKARMEGIVRSVSPELLTQHLAACGFFQHNYGNYLRTGGRANQKPKSGDKKPTIKLKALLNNELSWYS